MNNLHKMDGMSGQPWRDRRRVAGWGVPGVLATLIIMLALADPGCTTTTQVVTGTNGVLVTNVVKTLDTNAVRTTCALVVAVGTPLMPQAVQACPECKVWFGVAAGVINWLLAGGGPLDPDTVAGALAAARVRLPQAEVTEVRAVTEALAGVYHAYAAKVIAQKLDQTQFLRPVLQAIADLLQAGAQAPSPVAGARRAEGLGGLPGNLVVDRPLWRAVMKGGWLEILPGEEAG